MTDLQKRYTEYRSRYQKLSEQIDAWYIIADQKQSEGDKDGQRNAYTEIKKLEVQQRALVNPLDEDDEYEGDLSELLN